MMVVVRLSVVMNVPRTELDSDSNCAETPRVLRLIDSRVNTTHTSATQTCEHFDHHDDDAPDVTYSPVVPAPWFSERNCEQFLVPQVMEADEDFEGFSQERISERIGDQVVDVSVPQIMPEIIEVPAPALVIGYVAPAPAACCHT